MDAILYSVLDSVLDDWTSDLSVQGDFRVILGTDRPAALPHMRAAVPGWIRAGLLIAGQYRNGFEPWPGTPDDQANLFTEKTAGLTEITEPGEVCYFAKGPNAAARFAELPPFELPQ